MWCDGDLHDGYKTNLNITNEQIHDNSYKIVRNLILNYMLKYVFVHKYLNRM